MTTQRGLTCIGGNWYAPAADDVVIALGGAPDDRLADQQRVLDALRLLDAPRGPTLFALSYEASVALDPRLPRKRGDARLGPDVLVRALAPTQRPVARAPLARVPVRMPDDAARTAHLARVRRAHELLLDGVIYQANLAHRLAVEPVCHDDGLAFFLDATKAGQGPPCAAFVDVPGWGSVVSLSPERFLSVDPAQGHGGASMARAFPIKGTRARGRDAVEDARLLAELCASEKDAAEHVMIVDLLRNDLGKLAVAGGVTVERLLDLVSVKNVHHLESSIAARLRDGTSTSALLQATAPGGSITGAPKSSAVEVIHALEDGPRGLYTGVLGLIDGATLRSSLLIRTWLRPDDSEGSLHVGGGIVIDSEPAAEWQETLDKAAAFAR